MHCWFKCVVVEADFLLQEAPAEQWPWTVYPSSKLVTYYSAQAGGLPCASWVLPVHLSTQLSSVDLFTWPLPGPAACCMLTSEAKRVHAYWAGCSSPGAVGAVWRTVVNAVL